MRGRLTQKFMHEVGSMSSAERPKLMFVLGLAPQKIGGIEKFLRHFVLAMDDRGWDTVLCFDGVISSSFREFIGHPSVTIESVDGQANLGFACAGTLWTLLRRERPQIFVYAFHGVMRCFPQLARLAGAKRIFFNDHSSRPMGVLVAPLSLPKRIVGRMLTAPLTGIVSVCEFVKRTGAILGLAKATNTVVWNGVEIGEPEPARGRLFRQQHGIPEHATVLLMVCWMVQVKGVEVLLKASAELLRQQPETWVLLVGEGPKLGAYQALARDLGVEDRVRFTGLVNDPIASGVFDAGDVYCQPSLWQEANPLAVLEAMSMGLPVVASDIGGLPEIVLEGRTGYLFPPGDSGALYERLTRLVEDAAQRRSLGGAGRERVLQHHKVSDVAERYVALFLG